MQTAKESAQQSEWERAARERVCQ